MGKPTGDRASKNDAPKSVDRRKFLTQGAAAGVGAVAIAGAGIARGQRPGQRFDPLGLYRGRGRDRRRRRRPAGRDHGARQRRLGHRRR